MLIVVLLLLSVGRRLLVPGALAAHLLARLQRLPRFDNTAVIEAIGSVRNARFLLWKGTRGEALQSANAAEADSYSID